MSGVGDPGCWWCEGWGCRRCRDPLLGGEQAPSNEEVELGQLRSQVQGFKKLAREMERRVLNDEPAIEAVALELMRAVLGAT